MQYCRYSIGSNGTPVRWTFLLQSVISEYKTSLAAVAARIVRLGLQDRKSKMMGHPTDRQTRRITGGGGAISVARWSRSTAYASHCSLICVAISARAQNGIAQIFVVVLALGRSAVLLSLIHI